jgi:hypothetical protein
MYIMYIQSIHEYIYVWNIYIYEWTYIYEYIYVWKIVIKEKLKFISIEIT